MCLKASRKHLLEGQRMYYFSTFGVSFFCDSKLQVRDFKVNAKRSPKVEDHVVKYHQLVSATFCGTPSHFLSEGVAA